MLAHSSFLVFSAVFCVVKMGDKSNLTALTEATALLRELNLEEKLSRCNHAFAVINARSFVYLLVLFSKRFQIMRAMDQLLVER